MIHNSSDGLTIARGGFTYIVYIDLRCCVCGWACCRGFECAQVTRVVRESPPAWIYPLVDKKADPRRCFSAVVRETEVERLCDWATGRRD